MRGKRGGAKESSLQSRFFCTPEVKGAHSCKNQEGLAVMIAAQGLRSLCVKSPRAELIDIAVHPTRVVLRVHMHVCLPVFRMFSHPVGGDKTNCHCILKDRLKIGGTRILASLRVVRNAQGV